MNNTERFDGRGPRFDFDADYGASYDIVYRATDLTGWTDWWAGVTVAGNVVELNVDDGNQGDGFVLVQLLKTVTDDCNVREHFAIWAKDVNGLDTPMVFAAIRFETPKVAP